MVFFIGYSFLNRFLTTKSGLIKIDNDYSNFWIPILIIYIPTFFILRPAIKKSGFSTNIQDGLLWALLPFSISIPTAFSQQYIKDITYQVIEVDSPDKILSYPKERFFKIKSYYVNRNDFTVFKERHVSGGRSKSLKVNNYYIAPMYSDSVNKFSKIAYGIIYSTSLNHGLLFRDEQPDKIRKFNAESEHKFSTFDFNSVIFFEKQLDSEDEKNFAASWQNNSFLSKLETPTVLVGKNETFSDLLRKGRKMTLYSIFISLTITICLLMIFNHYKKEPSD